MSNSDNNPNLPELVEERVEELRKRSRVPEDMPSEVVAAMCEGDHDAYKLIYTNYEKSFRNFIYALTRSEEAAKDISQEVFITLWEKRGQLDPSKSIVKYLYKIGKNAVLQQYRHKLVHDKYSRFAESQDNRTPDVDGEVIARETEILIKIAVSRMPPQRRKVFEMGRYEGLSYDEIAQQLNISSSSVRSHMQLALKDIKEILAFFMVLFISSN